MIEVIRDHECALDSVCGTYKVGSLVRVSYWDLKSVLGNPTFDEPSGDDKIQKEWVVEYKGEVFTVYDWKTYDERYTVEELDVWSIGGKTSSVEFEKELLRSIKPNKVNL